MDSMMPIIELKYRNRIEALENNIMKAVADVGVVVNKERLEKALYDVRFFYREGYAAAEKRLWRHGHNTGNARIFECSECGYGYDDIYLTDEHHFDPEEINYCPNCGAKMDKENDNADS